MKEVFCNNPKCRGRKKLGEYDIERGRLEIRCPKCGQITRVKIESKRGGLERGVSNH